MVCLNGHLGGEVRACWDEFMDCLNYLASVLQSLFAYGAVVQIVQLDCKTWRVTRRIVTSTCFNPVLHYQNSNSTVKTMTSNVNETAT